MAVGQIATEWLHTSNNSFYYGCQSRGDELYAHCSCFEDKNQEISQAGEVLLGRVKRNVSICPTAVFTTVLVVNIVVFYRSIYYNFTI